MARQINITCRYYRVMSLDEPEEKARKAYDLRNWFKIINAIGVAERIKQIGTDVRGRIEEIKYVRDQFYALNFVRMDLYSAAYTLTEKDNAKHVDISVGDGEYIGKNSVAIYDEKNCVLMLMVSQGGFSPHTVNDYINSFFDKPVCYLEPFDENKDFAKPTNKYKQIEIKISKTNEYFPHQNPLYENVIKAARNAGANTFSFQISVGKKKREYLDADVVKTIISDALHNMGAISIARVKMEDEEGTALYNLFDDVKHCVLTLAADIKGEISPDAIAEEMIRQYRIN